MGLCRFRLFQSLVRGLFIIPLVTAYLPDALADPGEPDSSFGTAGISVTDFRETSDSLRDVAVQSDGKIVGVGVSYNKKGGQPGQVPDFLVVRWNEDGTLDTSFDSDGHLIYNANPENEAYNLQAVLVQPDGKILVGGGRSSIDILYRLNSDGSFDSTFGGSGGLASGSIGGIRSTIFDLLLQPDGKIIAVGGGDGDFHVARYLSNGRLDRTFDGDGRLTTDFGGRSDVPFAVALQQDGKIVVAGTSGDDADGAHYALARYLSNGIPDSSFGTNGLVTTDVGISNKSLQAAKGVGIQSDGKIVVAGLYPEGSSNYNFGILRYETDGTVDEGFGGKGYVSIDFIKGGGKDNDFAEGLVIQPDDKIVVVGRTGVSSGPATSWNFAVARLHPDGTPDMTFSGDGEEVTDIPDGHADGGYAVALQSDAKIVVVGDSTYAKSSDSVIDSVLVRYLDYGLSVSDLTVQEPDFDDGGPETFTVTLATARSVAVSVDYEIRDGAATFNDDYIVAGGSSTGTLSFAPGDTTKTINVWITGDLLVEGDETFEIKLSNPVNATIVDFTGIGTIVDNDTGPEVTVNDITIQEPAEGEQATGTFTITLSRASEQTITVDYGEDYNDAEPGIDFGSFNGTLTFEPGETVKTVNVTVMGDSLDEENEVFFIALSGATNATIIDDYGDAVIQDNDGPLPTLSINDASGGETEDPLDPARTLAFTVMLSAPHAEVVMVDYETVNGTALMALDYVPEVGQLNFSPGETSKTIRVSILDDTISTLINILPEETETFTLRLSRPFNATIADGEGIGTITENDGTRTLTISNATSSEAGGTMIFTASISETSRSDVRFRWEAVTDGTARMALDFAPDLGQVTIEPGATEATFSIRLLNDDVEEPEEIFSVTISEVENANLTSGTVSGTITDDDEEPTPNCGDGICDSSEEGVCAVDCDEEDDGGNLGTPEECLVIATNFITGEECGRTVILEGEEFSVACDPLKIADPEQRSKLRVALQVYCQTVTYGMFYETDYSEDQFDDGLEEVEAGEIDTEQTIAFEMLKDHLDENGMETIRDFEPACFVSFMDRFYTSASRDETTLEGGMGGAKDVLKCLIRENLSPSLYGFSNYQDLISAIREGSLTAEVIQSLSEDVDSHCDYDAAVMRIRLDEAQQVTRRITRFAATGLCDEGEVFEKMKQDSGWVDAAVQSVQTLSSRHIQDGDRAFEIVEDLIEEGMEEEGPGLFTNEMHQHVLLGVIETGMDGAFSRGHLDAVLELVEGLDLEEGDLSGEQLQELGELFINMAPELRDHLEDSQDAWLIANYLADSIENGEMDQETEDDLLSDPDEFLDELDRHDESVRECRRERGRENGQGRDRDCLDDIDPIDQLLGDDEDDDRGGPPEERGRQR